MKIVTGSITRFLQLAHLLPTYGERILSIGTVLSIQKSRPTSETPFDPIHPGHLTLHVRVGFVRLPATVYDTYRTKAAFASMSLLHTSTSPFLVEPAFNFVACSALSVAPQLPLRASKPVAAVDQNRFVAALTVLLYHRSHRFCSMYL